MKKRKSILGLIVLLTIMMSVVFITGCSTFPTAPLIRDVEMSYDILGYVGFEYASYSEAIAAARTAYPNADAVIRVKGMMDDNLIPQSGYFGYYAIKFKTVPKTPKGLLALFGGNKKNSSD